MTNTTLIIIVTVFAIIALIIFYFFMPKNFDGSKAWESLMMERSGRVKRRPASQQEMDKIRPLVLKKRQLFKEKRESGQIQRPRLTLAAIKQFPKRGNRLVIGPNADQFKDHTKPLEMLNKISTSWKDNVGREVLAQLPEGTQCFIQSVEPLIQLEHGKGRYVETVVITISLPGDIHYAYNATVDSGSGKLIHSWDQVRYELNLDEIKKNIDRKNKPTGTL